MPWRREDEVRIQCYPSGKSIVLRIAGFALIGVGILLVLLCVPLWAWLALIGAGLILLGLLLIKKWEETGMAIRVICVRAPRGLRGILRLLVREKKAIK